MFSFSYLQRTKFHFKVKWISDWSSKNVVDLSPIPDELLNPQLVWSMPCYCLQSVRCWNWQLIQRTTRIIYSFNWTATERMLLTKLSVNPWLGYLPVKVIFVIYQSFLEIINCTIVKFEVVVHSYLLRKIYFWRKYLLASASQQLINVARETAFRIRSFALSRLKWSQIHHSCSYSCRTTGSW